MVPVVILNAIYTRKKSKRTSRTGTLGKVSLPQRRTPCCLTCLRSFGMRFLEWKMPSCRYKDSTKVPATGAIDTGTLNPDLVA